MYRRVSNYALSEGGGVNLYDTVGGNVKKGYTHPRKGIRSLRIYNLPTLHKTSAISARTTLKCVSSSAPWKFEVIDGTLFSRDTKLTLKSGRFPIHPYFVQKPEPWKLTYTTRGEEYTTFVNLISTARDDVGPHDGELVTVEPLPRGGKRARRGTKKARRTRRRSSRRN